jgi:hypothetical protein
MELAMQQLMELAMQQLMVLTNNIIEVRGS